MGYLLTEEAEFTRKVIVGSMFPLPLGLRLCGKLPPEKFPIADEKMIDNDIDFDSYLVGVYIYSILRLYVRRGIKKLTSASSFFEDEVTNMMIEVAESKFSNEFFEVLADEIAGIVESMGFVCRENGTVRITTYLAERLHVVYGDAWIVLVLRQN